MSKPTEQDIANMSYEELQGIEVEDDDEVTPKEQEESEEKPESSEEDKGETKEKTGSKSDEEEKGEGEKEETKEGDESEGKEDLPQDPEVLSKRFKDTQSAYHKVNQELKAAQKRIKELEESTAAQRFQNFEELSPEEEVDLYETDKEAYDQYKKDLGDYKNFQVQQEQAKEEAVTQKTYENVLTFAKEHAGIDIDNAEELKEFFEGDNYKTLAQYVTENYKPVDEGAFSVKQIKDAYTALNFDELAAKERVKARSDTVEDIEKAANGGSRLDRAQKSAPPKRKAPKEYTLEEIDSMSEEEINKNLAEMDE